MAKASDHPKRKRCTGPCGKTRLAKFFRVLTSGYLQGMCIDCEREYDRLRWHQRTDASKQGRAAAAA